MNQELLKGLTKEQIAEAKQFKNSAELLSLAKAEGIELTKKILMAFVFNQGETYNLESDINNAPTLYHNFSFIKPAHFLGLYTCYLRTKISA